ncbi:unnamed protein product [Schistosoma margrebowiei]|uniref:Uncharacterized protein n=1 Tax=Schistosoma margrebowiei TaxID=48269 RepID=A0A183M5Y0_9TREM|nr:unnamed protein product [Schistosoma margrebowiei]
MIFILVNNIIQLGKTLQRTLESTSLTKPTQYRSSTIKSPEAKYQKAINGPNRDIFAGDLVVSKGYRDRARIQAWLQNGTEFARSRNQSVRIMDVFSTVKQKHIKTVTGTIGYDNNSFQLTNRVLVIKVSHYKLIP